MALIDFLISFINLLPLMVGRTSWRSGGFFPYRSFDEFHEIERDFAKSV
jgi:hypothetical protein